MASASPAGLATIVLDADGHYLDASQAALELLRIDLATLRALPPGSLRDPDDPPLDDARRQHLIAAAAKGIAGEANIRRPDGTGFRGRFIIVSHPERPGLFLATIEWTSSQGATVVRTLPESLEAWREADRNLRELEPGSPEWQAATERAEAARAEYQRLSRAHDR